MNMSSFVNLSRNLISKNGTDAGDASDGNLHHVINMVSSCGSGETRGEPPLDSKEQKSMKVSKHLSFSNGEGNVGTVNLQSMMSFHFTKTATLGQ